MLGYSTAQFVRLALLPEVSAAGLDLVVEVEAPKKKRRAARSVVAVATE